MLYSGEFAKLMILDKMGGSVSIKSNNARSPSSVFILSDKIFCAMLGIAGRPSILYDCVMQVFGGIHNI
jgi:hypothetical protein